MASHDDLVDIMVFGNYFLLGFWVSLQLGYLEVLLVFLAPSIMNKNEGSFVMSLCQYNT